MLKKNFGIFFCAVILGQSACNNIDHEGIEDGQVGKGSLVHYYHNGKWLKLTGAD